MKTSPSAADRPTDTITIGPAVLLAWTITIDNPNGEEVISAYIPVGDRDYPDGKVLVGGQSYRKTGAATREDSIEIGRQLTLERLQELGALP